MNDFELVSGLIDFLLPFVLYGGIGALIWFAVRRSNRKLDAEKAQASVELPPNERSLDPEGNLGEDGLPTVGDVQATGGRGKTAVSPPYQPARRSRLGTAVLTFSILSVFALAILFVVLWSPDGEPTTAETLAVTTTAPTTTTTVVGFVSQVERDEVNALFDRGIVLFGDIDQSPTVKFSEFEIEARAIRKAWILLSLGGSDVGRDAYGLQSQSFRSLSEALRYAIDGEWDMADSAFDAAAKLGIQGAELLDEAGL